MTVVASMLITTSTRMTDTVRTADASRILVAYFAVMLFVAADIVITVAWVNITIVAAAIATASLTVEGFRYP